MSRKFLIAAVLTGAVVGVGVTWLATGVREVGLWALWFGSLPVLLGVYAGANVIQKDVVSKNYRPELDEKERHAQ